MPQRGVLVKGRYACLVSVLVLCLGYASDVIPNPNPNPNPNLVFLKYCINL